MIRSLALLLPLTAVAAPVPVELFQCADPNLEVTVWAAPPLLRNPTNIDIDQHGRIWVAEGVNYRKMFDREPKGDRIMVLEDTDKDGKADKSWAFVQEPFLRTPLGVAVIGNKVVVSMAPDLVVYTDKDGDAVFDPAKGDTREVLLTGFNGRNHDHSLHSVTVGPDGKWYFSAGNCGAKFTDKSGKTFRISAKQDASRWPQDPKLPDWDPNEIAGQKSDDGRAYVGGFIARMDPDGSNVEILAHNLRNSYENCVTSFGDIFASDNDDQPACRVFAVLEGGNYGFASADGARTWQADRRPGQNIQTATWRQDDPGVAPAGDIYGGGAPTGCVFYENGALGEKHEGTLLVCASARNTIFGYKPQPDGAGWKLERFDFLTTNKAGEFAGADFKGGSKGIKPEDTKTLFRPSDIAVGPDGALYISDWLDPRTGGHATMDDAMEGTIYRIAPKGFKSVVPKVEFTTVAGAIQAMKSHAVNVRGQALNTLQQFGQNTVSELSSAMKGQHKDYWVARLENAQKAVRHKKLQSRKLGDLKKLVEKGDQTAQHLAAKNFRGKENEELRRMLADKEESSKPEGWGNYVSSLMFQLHPPQSIPAFQTRALFSKLPLKARLEALTAIGFNVTPEAAAAMLEVVVAKGKQPPPPGKADPPSTAKADEMVRETALWWLLNRKDNTWKVHNLNAVLKERGIYDPEKITLLPAPPPEPVAATYTVADAAKLPGDAKRGEAVSAKCFLCHQIGEVGVDYGPDLTTFGRTQTTEALLKSIIEPEADIAHGFHGIRVETKDGQIIEGLLLTDSDPLIVRSPGGLTQMVPVARVKEKTGLRGRSLMMSAVQMGLSAQEAADVAAYLRAR